jgi:hypothetical protein
MLKEKLKKTSEVRRIYVALIEGDACIAPTDDKGFPATIAEGKHPIPFRTRK